MNTLRKSHLLMVICLMLSIYFTSCKDDELPAGGITINEGTTLIWERACNYHTLHIDTELPWTIEVEGSWITPLLTDGTGVTELQVYVEQNDNEGDRQGIIRITPKGYKATEISVRQKGINTSDDNSERDMKNLIGFGYSLKGEYLTPQAIKTQIFNPEKVNNVNIIHATSRDTTMLSYTDKLTSFYNLGYYVCIKETGGGDSQYFPIENYYSEESKNDEYQKKCNPLFRKYDISYEYKLIKNQYSIPEDAFTEDFIKAIKDAPNQRTANNNYPYYNREYLYNIFDKFGTHVIIGEYFGGSIIYGITVDKETGENDILRTAALEIGWKRRLGFLLDKTERGLVPMIDSHYHDKMTIIGGDESLLANLLTENSSCTTEELENWEKTISPERPMLIRLKLCTIFDILPYSLKDDHPYTLNNITMNLNLSFASSLIRDYNKR